MGYSAHYWPQDRLCITDSCSQSEPNHSASLWFSSLSAHSVHTSMRMLWMTGSKSLLKSTSAKPTVLHTSSCWIQFSCHLCTWKFFPRLFVPSPSQGSGGSWQACSSSFFPFSKSSDVYFPTVLKHFHIHSFHIHHDQSRITEYGLDIC